MATSKKITIGFVFLALGLVLVLAAISSRQSGQQKPRKSLSPVSSLDCPFLETYGAVFRCFRLRLSFVSGNEKMAFHVPVAVFSRQNSLSPDALIYIPGGPGDGDQTSLSNLEYWSYWYSETNIDQDLVIYNPRGLRGSSPAWNCADFDDLSFLQIQTDLNYRVEQKEAFYSLQACVQQLEEWLSKNELSAEDYLQAFSAVGLAADVNDIAEKLGYSQWHLWGVSFGSRVAMLAAHHPQVETVVLEGVYSFGVGGLGDDARNLNRSITLWEEIFEQDSRSKHSSFTALFLEAIKSVETESIALKLDYQPQVQTGLYLPVQNKDARSKGKKNLLSSSVVINAQRLKSIAFFALYSPALYEPFIQSLYDLVSGEGSESSSLSLVVESLIYSMFDPGFNPVKFYLAECADRVEPSRSALAEILQQRYTPEFPGWRDWISIFAEYNICEDKIFSTPGASLEVAETAEITYAKKPTLLFSGVWDPVTPKEWGDLASKGIGKAKHYKVEGAAHGVLLGNYCDWGFWKEFLNSKNLDVPVDCRVNQN